MTAFLVDLQISSQSTEYVKVPVAADDDSDPTSNAVHLSFPTAGGEPTSFFSGSWETIGPTYYARALVGASGGVTTLPVGFYDVYVKISTTSETPVLFAGRIEVT